MAQPLDMPFVFADNWYKPPLGGLKDPILIHRFWLAKSMMRAKTPGKITELKQTLSELETKQNGGGKFSRQDAEKLKKTKESLSPLLNAMKRGKVTPSIVKGGAGFEMNAFRTAAEVASDATLSKDQLDARLEQIHNDRLRLNDIDMLKTYRALDISIAIFEAAPHFKSNATVAEFFTTALAPGGKPVVITQGVHQAGDPHFDVKMPDAEQQIHVNVELDPNGDQKVRIITVSYMKGPRKADGTQTVPRDGVIAS
jgi:hypothetical protein